MTDTPNTSELIDLVNRLRKELETTRAEAIREFAEKLKKEFYGGYYDKPFIHDTINDILKEMAGEKNGKN